VEIATKYEQTHVERVEVLRQRVSAQEAELALAERDVTSMSSELKAVLAGQDPRAAASIDTGEQEAGESAGLKDEIDSMARARAREEREADAARRLDELKRRMGK
jgi:hypothetical protein